VKNSTQAALQTSVPYIASLMVFMTGLSMLSGPLRNRK
jgi:hypothetical protein